MFLHGHHLKLPLALFHLLKCSRVEHFGLIRAAYLVSESGALGLVRTRLGDPF